MTTKKRPGPQSKLDTPACRALIRALRVGVTIRAACAIAEISQTQFYVWLRRAEAEPDSAYAKFAAKVRATLAAVEVDAMKTIIRAGKRSWQARAWQLERRWPADYGRRMIDMSAAAPAQPPVVSERGNVQVSDAEATA